MKDCESGMKKGAMVRRDKSISVVQALRSTFPKASKSLYVQKYFVLFVWNYAWDTNGAFSLVVMILTIGDMAGCFEESDQIYY